MGGTHETGEQPMGVTVCKRRRKDLKMDSIEFYAEQYGEDVLVGQMTRFTGERTWRIYYRGEFQGSETKSVAFDWLTGRATKLVIR